MDSVKTRSSLLAVGLLAMAALPDESAAQQGVPSRYGYNGETGQKPRPQQVAPRPAPLPRGAYVVPARAPHAAPRPATAAPVKKTVASAPKKSAAPKPAVAKAVPAKKPKTVSPEPKKKAIAKAEPPKKSAAKSAPKAVASAAQKTPSKNTRSAPAAATQRPVKIARSKPAATPSRNVRSADANAGSETKKTALASNAKPTTRTSSGLRPATGASAAGLHLFGMSLPAAWAGAAVRTVDTRHTVDLAGAARDLELAQPKNTAAIPNGTAAKPVSHPSPSPSPAPEPESDPIEMPDTRLAATDSPAPTAADMPPPPEASVLDSVRTATLISGPQTVATHTSTLTRSAADDMPAVEALPEPAAISEPEPEPAVTESPSVTEISAAETGTAAPGAEAETTPEAEPEPEAQTPPAAVASIADPVEKEEEDSDPGIDLLTGLPRVADSPNDRPGVEEPPLPSNDPPARHDDDGEPDTRTAALESRDKELVRTITTAVKGAAAGRREGTESDRDSASSAVAAVKNVASQWFDEGKTPKAAAVKAAVREAIADRIPETGLPLELMSDLLPSAPEAMPDRMPKFNAPATGKIDIQSDRQADYDQANNRVTFTGKVELNSSTLRLRADRIEVSMKKSGGMDVIHATGNVLMRTQDTASSTGQIASAGSATYDVKSGEIVLSEWPKIQESGKALISTDPSTKMYLYTDGRLRTEGPNRTIIGR